MNRTGKSATGTTWNKPNLLTNKPLKHINFQISIDSYKMKSNNIFAKNYYYNKSRK